MTVAQLQPSPEPAATTPSPRDVCVAMSGGVDSSVAAALLVERGHRVVGVTMRLWGGESDTGCCSVSDVDDARRVADQLGIEHHVFNFADDFTAHVVDPYVADHAAGRTPNPCIECNRHLKFDRLLRRAGALGFDALATGHHARVVERPDGTRRVARGVDAAKDQSYVLHMLTQAELARVLLPIGGLTKDDVRARATDLGLRTAHKPDSQDVCFITSSTGRAGFLGRRIPLREGRLLDTAGTQVGTVDAVELVTVGQRRGLGVAGSGQPRFAVDVDVETGTVVVGGADDLLARDLELDRVTWAHEPVSGPVLAQCSAHGSAVPAAAWADSDSAETGRVRLVWDQPRARVAPGQSVAFYDVGAPDQVLGGGIAVRRRPT